MADGHREADSEAGQTAIDSRFVRDVQRSGQHVGRQPQHRVQEIAILGRLRTCIHQTAHNTASRGGRGTAHAAADGAKVRTGDERHRGGSESGPGCPAGGTAARPQSPPPAPLRHRGTREKVSTLGPHKARMKGQHTNDGTPIQVRLRKAGTAHRGRRRRGLRASCAQKTEARDGIRRMSAAMQPPPQTIQPTQVNGSIVLTTAHQDDSHSAQVVHGIAPRQRRVHHTHCTTTMSISARTPFSGSNNGQSRAVQARE